MRWLSPLPLALAFATSGCAPAPVDAFTKAIRGAEEVRLHEGLPHPMFEADKLEAERRTKKVQEKHGYAFYEALVPMSAADATELSAILSQPTSFKEFSGEKKCGGFHPDYAAEWTRGQGRTYEALICFG